MGVEDLMVLALLRATLVSSSALLVTTALFLVAGVPAAQAKVDVCHKPGEKQKVLSVEEQDVANHLGHRDTLVTAEVCDTGGLDEDCDGLIDCFDSDCEAACTCPCYQVEDFASVRVVGCVIVPLGTSTARFISAEPDACEGSAGTIVIPHLGSACFTLDITPPCPAPFFPPQLKTITDIQVEDCKRVLRQAAADDGLMCVDLGLP